MGNAGNAARGPKHATVPVKDRQQFDAMRFQEPIAWKGLLVPRLRLNGSRGFSVPITVERTTSCEDFPKFWQLRLFARIGVDAGQKTERPEGREGLMAERPDDPSAGNPRPIIGPPPRNTDLHWSDGFPRITQKRVLRSPNSSRMQ